MPLSSTVLISRGGDSWTADVEDISATGALVARPRDWNGAVGELFVLDILIGAHFDLHLEATVRRLTAEHIGFAYARIPEDKEVPLWSLLGSYADRLEPFGDDH
ncbi:MAG TPA: PilZ domain-containing protein [Rhodanobacteraceae bacterium]|nr:PilZ domain-containing protein [Rhodanobacteraceae bacterium]